jgi:hypothetical protein
LFLVRDTENNERINPTKNEMDKYEYGEMSGKVASLFIKVAKLETNLSKKESRKGAPLN